MKSKHEDLEALEALLARELVPMQPDSAFLEQVEARLQEPRTFEVAGTDATEWPSHPGPWFLMGMGIALFLTGLGLWFWWKVRQKR